MDDLERPDRSFYAAVEGLRDDVREDIRQLREDVRSDARASEDRLMGVMAQFAKAHSVEHDEDRIALDKDLTTFRAFMHAAEIAQAKRDGALGVLRFVVELLSKHARPIVALVASIGIGAALFMGHVSIEVVAR